MQLPQFTFLRFMAAMLVVVYHYGGAAVEELAPGMLGAVRNGAVAVAFFYFLSGTVLGISYLGKATTATAFWKRRVARIAPLYVLAFCATLMLQMVLLGDRPRVSGIVAQLLAVHAWIPGECLAINYPGWSISVEVLFYAVCPLLLYWFRQWSGSAWALLMFGVWLTCMAVRHWLVGIPSLHPEFLLYFPPWHLGSFTMGLLCGACLLHYKHADGMVRWSPLILLCSVAMGCLLFGSSNRLGEAAHNGGAAPVFFLLLFGLGMYKGWLSTIMAAAPLRLLGEASYAMYLLQYPAFMCYTGERAGSLGALEFTQYCTLLIALSLLVHFAFEKPAKRWVLSKWGHSGTKAAAEGRPR